MHLISTGTQMSNFAYNLAQRPEIAARGADVVLYETRLRQERVRPLVPTLAVGFSAGDFGGGTAVGGRAGVSRSAARRVGSGRL